MKKLLIFILVIAISSCSTSTDQNSNSNTPIPPVVPLAPSYLTGDVLSTTQIKLEWLDNSTDEMGFKIERKTVSTNYAVVGTANQNMFIFSDSGLTPNTTYTYRVCAYNANGNSTSYSNEVTLTTPEITIPTVNTKYASLLTQSSIKSGGNLVNDGGSAIITSGVCWSTSHNPTIALPTKTIDGIQTSSGGEYFLSTITGLIVNTTYYIKAYSTNSIGTAYGNEISFTIPNFLSITMNDIDGNSYQSVKICNQTWILTNLDVSKYSDGTPIPQVTNMSEWLSLTTGAWCYYNNDPANGAVYGKLYNWGAVAGIYDAASGADPALRKKLAPTGWHIPTDAEWTQLTDCLGGESVAGGKMKEAGMTHWNDDFSDNESGFTALPGGAIISIGSNLNEFGYWWSSSLNGDWYAYSRYMYTRNYITQSNSSMLSCGLSVRCLKD